MERSCTENPIEAIAKRQSEQVGNNKREPSTKRKRKILTRMMHHVAGEVETHDMPFRKILMEEAGQPPSATASVQKALIPA